MDRQEKNPFDPENIGYVITSLKINRFTLFDSAFKFWYGKNADKSIILAHIEKYQTDNDVPFWVRSYVRIILNDTCQKKNGKKTCCRKIFCVFVNYILPPIIVALLILCFWPFKF